MIFTQPIKFKSPLRFSNAHYYINCLTMSHHLLLREKIQKQNENYSKKFKMPDLNQSSETYNRNQKYIYIAEDQYGAWISTFMIIYIWVIHRIQKKVKFTLYTILKAARNRVIAVDIFFWFFCSWFWRGPPCRSLDNGLEINIFLFSLLFTLFVFTFSMFKWL